jgi:hypothetical protein
MRTLKLIPLFIVLFIAASSCSRIENLFNSDDENEREISISELPAAVLDAIAENYPGAELLEADEITNNDGSLTYDIEIRHDGSVFEVMYDTAGNFLGIEQDNDDENDEEND